MIHNCTYSHYQHALSRLTMTSLFTHLLISPKIQLNKKSIFHWTHKNHLHTWESASTTWVSPNNPFTKASLPSQGWVMLHTHYTNTQHENKTRFKEESHKLLTCKTQTIRSLFTNHIYNTPNLPWMKNTISTLHINEEHHGSWIPNSLQEMANEKL